MYNAKIKYIQEREWRNCWRERQNLLWFHSVPFNLLNSCVVVAFRDVMLIELGEFLLTYVQKKQALPRCQLQHRHLYEGDKR